MVLPPTQHYIHASRSWFQRLAVTVLVTGVLQGSISAVAQVQNVPITNQASYTYTDSATHTFQGTSDPLLVFVSRLIDLLGQILGCSGEIIPDYTGFSVAIYEPDPKDPTGTELGRLLPLTRTEFPPTPNSGVPTGKAPNITNSNPFLLTNTDKGVYNFLLDQNKGQTDPGRIYIFVINPPSNSIYQQRRVKIQILKGTNSVVQYIATSLDGQPITAKGETTTQGRVVLVPNAELVGLNLLAFQFTTNFCQPHQVQILKTGDRAAAEPGDTVIYRLSVKNLADTDMNKLVVTDTLPLGFKFLSKSVRGEIDGKQVAMTSQGNGLNVTLQTQSPIPQQKVLNIAYAAQLTPDSVRGSGRNTASVRC